MNLMQAHKQWRYRPEDERFESLQELKDSVSQRRSISHEGNILVSDMRVTPVDDDLVIEYHNSPMPLNMTHWAFGQVCSMVKAPAGYMRSLSADLAAECLNYSLPKNKENAKLLIIHNGSTDIRAVTSTSYGRIWDIDVVNALENILDANPSWKNPPAYKKGFGSPVVNSGLYASDRDVWMFFVDEDHKIEINGDELARGFFVWNSEVGKCTFGLTTFLYRYVCNNHIIWGASTINDIRVKHSLNAPTQAFGKIMPALRNYMGSSTEREVNTLRKSMDYRPAGLSKDKMLDWLQTNGFTKTLASRAYDTALAEEGDASSLWNILQGLTAVAREKEHVDTRVDLERKAGALLRYVN